MFKYNPVPFIFEKGDSYTKLNILEFFDLLNTQTAKKCLDDLLDSQKEDGGFPSGFDHNTSGVRETERAAFLLLRCGLKSNDPVIQRSLDFIIRHQRENGGFTEKSNLGIPSYALEFSLEKGMTWLTADIVELLRKLGLEKEDACQKAIQWLKDVGEKEGGWALFEKDEEVDPDSSAQITFLMKDLFGQDDPSYKRGLNLYRKDLDRIALDAKNGFYFRKGNKERNDIYHLTHLLGSSLDFGQRRAEQGFDVTDTRVKIIVDEIVRTQKPDGGWVPFWSEETSPLYAALVLKIFVWTKAIEKEEFKHNIRRYLHLDSSRAG